MSGGDEGHVSNSDGSRAMVRYAPDIYILYIGLYCFMIHYIYIITMITNTCKKKKKLISYLGN